ncbi:CaiB/BaiF CoA transferase family protein [Pseudoflavonifractor phocaeensis]|uniref:CaiB/BaiF CoA transferase family protein n=1 Tax=Pseudoflavonifractor phocaeensis TaxID=1870988 RepID=UPI0019589DB1|nr:CaiB/BaiF CoA-transferase family protein [Pseudoflavonifractor phocaeensis]MBM6722222.1 CoA transferase [Pseudoflavonifractor phocaeensis]
MKALDGVTIIDFTQRHAGSVATMILADFGAKVIKVERADRPDPAREWAPMQNGHSVYFTYLNRGKEGVCVDYTTDAGNQVILDLVKTADVVCENLPVGEMEKYGLDYESLKEIKPDLIYASLSPFGLTGPRKNKKADDLTIQAIGGYMDRTGFADGPATPVGCRVSNHISAAYLATSINLALIHKYKTGQGQMIDLSELDCLFAMMETGPWVYNINGKVLPRTGNSYPSISPYDTLKAKDGFLSVGISTDNQWQKFCAALGMTNLAQNELYMTNESRGDHYECGLKADLEAVTSQLGKFEMEATLREAKLPCAAVYTVPDAMASEHIAVREMLVEVEDDGAGKVTIPGTTVKLMRTPGIIEKGAPLLGGDTHDVLSGLGYDEDKLQQLKADGVICEA